MKAFISVKEASLDSMLDERFGRAAYFIVVDTDSGEIVKSINNEYINDAHGVGIKAASIAVKENVDSVIGPNFGPKVLEVLKAAGIKMYTSEVKKIKDIIEDYKNNKLSATL